MKGKLFSSILVFLIALFFQSACMADEFEDSLCQWVPRDINAKVTNINVKAMEITLKTSSGNTITFAVDKGVNNLSTFAVGDKIKARYYMSSSAEVRNPTPAEKKTPFSKIDETCPLPPKATPGSQIKMFRDIVTVLSYDPDLGLVLVKKSDGKNYWINLYNSDQKIPGGFEKGDVVLVKYSQPYLIALKKL
jgi:hypothetical protein